MAYIGKGLDNGVRNRFIYSSTQGQTAFTGSDLDGKTLTISDALYTDVYHNGVKIKLTTDWSSSTTTMTLVTGASVNDVIEIISFDVFGVPNTVPSFGGTFTGAISATSYGAVSGTTGTFSGNVTADKYIMAGGSQIGQDFAFLKAASTSEASLTLRKDSSGADSIDYLQMRSDGNGLISKITGAGVGHFTGIAVGGSGAANTLDDYEEGSWTPTFTQQSGVGVGKYTKIGRLVTAQGKYTCNTNANDADAVQMGGLPFSSDISNQCFQATWMIQNMGSGTGNSVANFNGVGLISMDTYIRANSPGNNPYYDTDLLRAASVIRVTVVYQVT